MWNHPEDPHNVEPDYRHTTLHTTRLSTYSIPDCRLINHMFPKSKKHETKHKAQNLMITVSEVSWKFGWNWSCRFGEFLLEKIKTMAKHKICTIAWCRDLIIICNAHCTCRPLKYILIKFAVKVCMQLCISAVLISLHCCLYTGNSLLATYKLRILLLRHKSLLLSLLYRSSAIVFWISPDWPQPSKILLSTISADHNKQFCRPRCGRVVVRRGGLATLASIADCLVIVLCVHLVVVDAQVTCHSYMAYKRDERVRIRMHLRPVL